MRFKIDMLKLLKRLKYRKNTLCWGINVKTMSVFYVDVES